MLKNIKRIIFSLLKGKICPVIKGPLRGLWFEMSEATGLAALISGGSSSEGDTQRQIKKHCHHGTLVLDCGANWGLHTLFMSRLVGVSGKVVAVEASPSICRILKKNILINQIQNIQVIEKALSNRDGSIQFNAGVGATTGRIAKEKEQGDMVEVPATTVDEVLRNQRADVSLVKMDIEGAESNALEGAYKTLSISRPVFIIELHSPENDLKVGENMIRHRYQLFRLNGEKILKPDRPWPDPDGVHGTIVCIPEEKTAARHI
jgi:FkbM family methyltransferase